MLKNGGEAMNEKKREKMEEQLAKKARAIEEYASVVIVKNETELLIDGDQYQLIKNYHNAFQVDKLKERFSPILTKFDYIVGDIGYDQLRLHGFYENNRKVQSFQKIEQLQDYLLEYCNFGCPYFILKNMNVHESFPIVKPNSKKRNVRRKKRNEKHSDNIKTVKSTNKRQGSRHFVIRQKRNKVRRNK